MSGALGATDDPIATPGGEGSLTSKLRLLTSQMQSLVAALSGGTTLAGTSAVSGVFSLATPLPLLTVDTELPAASGLIDGTVNPTAPLAGLCLLLYNGATWDRVRTANTRKDQSTVAIGTSGTVWAPTTGKKFRLMGGSISVSAAASVLFEDNVSGNFVFRTPKLAADTPYNFDLGNGYLSVAANNVLKATSSAAANLLGTLWGVEE